MYCNDNQTLKNIDRRAMLRPLTSGLVLMVLFLVGCGTSQNTVDYGYGKKSGAGFANSLNGTRVFAKMFENRGYRVESRPTVTPTMGEADTVVWFPNHYHPPKKEVVDTLQKWLDAEPNRVLVYVGRDYDAEVPYWSESLKKAKPDQVDKFRRRYAIAKARELRRVGTIPTSTIFENIRFTELANPQTINAYQGPLADGAITLDQPITIRQTLSWAGTTGKRSILRDGWDTSRIVECRRVTTCYVDSDRLLWRIANYPGFQWFVSFELSIGKITKPPIGR